MATRLARLITVFVVALSSLELLYAEPSALDVGDKNEFISTPKSQFQWWVDPQSKKINFRLCNRVRQELQCFGPMLIHGLDIRQVPAMLSFYRERLAQSGNHQLQQFIRVLSGSVGTIAAYIGTIGSLSFFKNAYPQWFATKTEGLFSLRTGVHAISIGALGMLLFYGIESYVHLNRQKRAYKIYCAAIGPDPQAPPDIALQSQTLFEEFVTTFRRALFDFTHGGGTFDDNGYLIFQ